MIFAVDAASLETLWSEDLGAAIPGSPVFGPDGMIYVTSFSNKMERLDPATGARSAVVETENWVWNGPTVAGETLYFGDVAGNFYSFDLPAGQLTWTPIKLDNAITAGPLVVDELVLVATESGDVYEVDAEGQSKIWSDAEGSVYTTPVIAGELILVAPTQGNRYLAAFDRTGHLKWQFPPGE
jgi:outer membrane protein assembly factor BamB